MRAGTGDPPQVWLGPTSKRLTPVSLTRTAYKDVKLLDEFGGHVVYTHIYFLIRPGQLSPGKYRVRYEDELPGERKFVARGTLAVLPQSAAGFELQRTRRRPTKAAVSRQDGYPIVLNSRA